MRALWCAVTLLAATTAAAEPITFDRCGETPEARVVRRGDVVRIDCDRAVVLNTRKLAEAEDAKAEVAKLRGIDTVKEERIANLKDQLAAQADAIVVLKQASATRDESYQVVLASFHQADQLVAQSVKNTGDALALARATRRTSYLTAALTGAAAGGLGGLQISDSGGGFAVGAAVGALAGFGLTWLLLPR
jgi:hypothetical protein